MTQRKKNQDRELLLRIKTILVLRVVFLTGFMVLIFTFQQYFGFSAPLVPLSLVVGCGYFFSIIYALLFKLLARPSLVASVQVAGDLALVVGILYATGGIDSPLTFLNLLVIISTSIMLPRAACYMAASAASILYGLLVDLEYFNVIHPVHLFPESKVPFESGYGFYIILINVASYFAVAYLSSILYQRLRVVKEQLVNTSTDLQKLQAFNENVLQNMGNGLITTDLEGKITTINRAGEDIVGYNGREILGQPCKVLLESQALSDFFDQAEVIPLPQEIEGQWKRKDGETISVRMKVSRLESHEDRAKGYIFVFEDLTEIKAMHERVSQSEQLAAVGRFSAGLAHEIRNPLASLSGSIQVLSEALKLDSNNRRLMDIVTKETDRLNAIVSDFLSYSQPRKNCRTLVDLTQTVQDVIVLMKNSEGYDPKIQIRFDHKSDHLVFMGDEQQIKQLVWNLCINGVQAMPGGGQLKIGLCPSQDSKEVTFRGDQPGVVLTVADEGGGIPQDQVKKIFDPFFTTKEDGVGLGLATVYQIAQRLGGVIDVQSQPGRGTRFSIFLPSDGASSRNGKYSVVRSSTIAFRGK